MCNFWKVKVLSFVHYFALRVIINRVATRGFLSRRIVIIRSTTCILCEHCEEIVNHL